MLRASCCAAVVLRANRAWLGTRAARALVLRCALLQLPASLSGPSDALATGPSRAEAVAGAASASPAPGGSSTGPAQESDSGASRLVLRRARLDNGLRIVLHRDTSLPTVAIGIAYGVGTRHEGDGEQGLARWLQHAMFNGSRNVAPGGHARLIREQGGSHAAWTSAEHTVFVELLPAHALALGLWLEADRMKSLELSAAELAWQGRLLELELEREARQQGAQGKRELAALVFADVARQAAPSRGGAAAVLPSRGPEQLLAALQAFRQRYYAPNNAVLTVAGHFEPLEALNLIQVHFAGAQPVELPPSPELQLPEQTQARRTTREARAGQAPALWQGWSIPGAREPEHDALELASVILGSGVGSRLHQLLVAEQGLATAVSTWTEGARGRDLFGVAVQLREGGDPEQASRLVLAQVAALARFGPSAAELQRAQRMLETRAWLELDGNLARARALCEAELFAHDARLLEPSLGRYRRVSREEVQRVLARYLRPARRSDVLLRARKR